MKQRIELKDEQDIVTARRLARQMAEEMGFSVMDQTRIAIAVSELSRNVLRYATNSWGIVIIEKVEGAQVGIEIRVEDDGPGMEVEQAMRDGYSSGHGLGLGLPGTRRLMDEMQIHSNRGSATEVIIRKWLN